MSPLNRRTFLKAAASKAVLGGAALGGLAPFLRASRGLAQERSLQIGRILDTSGVLDIYGIPMQKAASLAIDEINQEGGLLGRPINDVFLDAQSNLERYPELARQIVAQRGVDVAFAGITSASREAIRQIFREANLLYFYTVQYEGGVCDRNTFLTGITPGQQTAVMIPYAARNWGRKAYILAADYNYGHITAKWITHYLQRQGGRTLQVELFPLDVSDFAATIDRIRKAKPDFVASVLVGGAHVNFYRQWAAAGMKQRIPICSTTLGAGNEHRVLTPEEGNDILVSYNFAPENPAPQTRRFIRNWERRFGVNDIHELAAAHYQGIKLWAAAVKKARSTRRDAVTRALERRIAVTGPAGRISIDARTHHCNLDVNLMKINNQSMEIIRTYRQRPPLDVKRVCDLRHYPNTNKQYEIDI